MSRNIFRKQKEAFDYDHISLNIVKAMSDDELISYDLQEQSFLLLPFEHSEAIEDQVRSVSLAELLFSKLPSDADEGIKGFMKQLITYSIKHKEIIDKFGRYPHRNELLGRENTE